MKFYRGAGDYLDITTVLEVTENCHNFFSQIGHFFCFNISRMSGLYRCGSINRIDLVVFD